MATMPPMELFANPRARRVPSPPPDTGFATADVVRSVRRFHSTLPDYQPTPLHALAGLARHLGLGGIWIKDESPRFGLKAFKGLGAAYAVCATLAERLALPTPLDFRHFQDPEVRRSLARVTLVAASDGNHGIAVAWMAARLGCRSRIFLPAGTAPCRQAAVRAAGGAAEVIAGNYDDAVRRAGREAQGSDTLLIQDTSWEGYETIPRRVMQGYLTLFDEAYAQLGGIRPTHLMVPCGVGSLAASLQAFLVERYGADRPRLIVLEAAVADCYYRSMASGGRSVIPVTGPMPTRMAGLACGEPTRAGWDILRTYADAFVRCTDEVALVGMRRLAHPVDGDPAIESGECGAVTLGCLCRLMQPDHAADRQRLGLGRAARILLFSTEGATDPESYRQAVAAPPGDVPCGP